MKKIIITASVVFIGGMSFAQTTFLDTQAKVDAWTTTSVTGTLIINGNNITNITSLDALTSISGQLTIQTNPNLTSLEGLEGIENIIDLNIVVNDKLTNLSGLDNLTSVTTSVNINSNETLTSLEGLEKLTTIGSLGLIIYSNTKLSTLNGLNNLTALGGKLLIGTSEGSDIRENLVLTNFCAISQLVTGASPIAMNKYFVVNNAYNPTYTGLASGIVESAVGQNDGCAEFGTMLPVPPVVVSTNTFSKEYGYRLFPNPVSSVLYIESDSKITSISISNLSGQTVLKGNSTSINVRNLSKGIYFARIVSGEKTIVEKFVKL